MRSRRKWRLLFCLCRGERQTAAVNAQSGCAVRRGGQAVPGAGRRRAARGVRTCGAAARSATVPVAPHRRHSLSIMAHRAYDFHVCRNCLRPFAAQTKSSRDGKRDCFARILENVLTSQMRPDRPATSPGTAQKDPSPSGTSSPPPCQTKHAACSTGSSPATAH